MKRNYWPITVTLVSFGLALGIIVWFGVIYHNFTKAHASQPYQPGVSFSSDYARELGLDPHQTYLALLNDVGVRHFRLMSYWDTIESQPGKYDFSDLDFQMTQASNKGAMVSLAIGLRQPRWPECHQPAWADKLSATDRQARLQAFMSAVVEHYRNSQALQSYQLENEGLNTVFGVCPKADVRKNMISEFNLVKAIDPNHPIIVNVSNEFGLPLGQPRGDEVGLSVYQHIYDATVTHRYVNYLFPTWWHGLRAALIEQLLHRPVIIHELQAEPWGPGPTARLSVEEQNKSMDAAGVLKSVHYAQGTGIRQFYLWGGEWWYWRLTKFHDPSLWNAAKTIYQAN